MSDYFLAVGGTFMLASAILLFIWFKVEIGD
jgi:hypothetical protein